MSSKEVREWINTSVAIIGLFILIFSIIQGVNELQDLNVNLKNLESDKLSTKKIQLIKPDGSLSGCIQATQTGVVMGPCNLSYEINVVTKNES